MNSNLTLDSYLKNLDYEVVQDWNGGFGNYYDQWTDACCPSCVNGWYSHAHVLVTLRIDELYLNGNSITGTIPTELARLFHLGTCRRLGLHFSVALAGCLLTLDNHY